jgi:ABC-type antimicrobial peptide transport system permease subunit
MTIVGVVGDVRQDSPAFPPAPELYMPLRQHPYAANELQVVVRTRIPPESFIPTLHELVRTTNRDVAMKFTTLADSVNGSIAGQRFRTSLVSAFAGLAVALALTGIYAVMSYTIAQRTPEFGLRVAIGARSIDVVRLVLADAGRLSLAGVICGLLLAGATTRFLAASLFGVTPADAVTYGLVMLLGLPLVGLAAAVPALRAARVDPLIALRS